MKSQSNSPCEVENCHLHTQEPPQKGAASTPIITNSQERSRAKNAQVNSQELDNPTTSVRTVKFNTKLFKKMEAYYKLPWYKRLFKRPPND